MPSTNKIQGSPASRVSQLTQQGLWTNQTLHGLLAVSVASNPAALAVADQPNKYDLTGTKPLRLTYAQLDIASDNLALTLLAENIGHGDIILVQLPNSVELVACYFAASKIGAVISPIPVQYSRHELNTIQSTVKPALGISSSTVNGASIASQMGECITANVIAFGNGASDSQLDLNHNTKAACIITQHQYGIDDESYNGSHNSSDENFECKIDGNTAITLCWTSGTTGTPKGVPRTHNMWVATSNVIIESAKLQSGDILLNPFPLVNMAAIAGFLYPCAQLSLALALHHPIDISVFLSQLEKEKINFTIIPPALLNQLARKAELWNQFDFSNLRCIGSGSAPLSPWMIETFKTEYGKNIINFYGSNEGISLINTSDVTDNSEIRATMFPRFGAANTPWQGSCHQLVRSKVVDTETGNEILEAGKPGELMFAGATIFDGYFDPDQTIDNSTVFDSDGYFHTGDLVEICLDAPNFYRIVGRCKDIINRGGMKISPTEIDILLEGFSGLAEAAVCAYTDDTMGEKICACLVLAQGSPTPSIEILSDYLLDQGLAKFKLPEKIQLLTQLPRNPMGKVLRSELEQIVKNNR